MKQAKIVLTKGTTREDVLDTIESSTVNYMRQKRGLDETGMRDLITIDKAVFESYMRKIERAVWSMIGAGVPAAFFGK